MANVKNLKINIQSGTTNTAYATWEFDSKVTKTTPTIRVGSWVNIKYGAPSYNGVSLAGFVYSSGPWKVIQIDGARVVVNENRSGSNRIMTPVHINNLTAEGGGSTSVTEDTVDHYTVKWTYDTGNGVWFNGSSSDVNEKVATYSIPENALKIMVSVTPVSKTRDVNGQQTSYWSGSAVTVTYDTAANPPEVPPSPSVEVEEYTLTATVDNVSDVRSDEIEFQVYDLTTPFTSGTATVQACMASFQCKVNAGGEYRVRVRSANIYGTGRIYSDWTDFTDSVITIPAPPGSITKIRGASSTSVYLEWDTVNSAETYEIEYTTEERYFDSSSETTTISDIEYTHYEVTGLESGDEYFFRVRAVNSQGESAWTEVKSVVIGKKPAAPTTWSSATTVITGESVNLYWVHNAEDGSTERYAEVEITVGDHTETYTVENELADDEENPDKDATKHYTVDTSSYAEGTQIEWRVRTAGITLQYGDWSIMRTVDVYAPPTLQLSVTDQNGGIIQVLTSFPFFLKGLAGPKTQEPIGYHVTISADEGYETVDSIGRTKIVNAGEAVYSRFIDTKDPLLLEFTPSNIDLENGISYTIAVVVSMNSGLNTIATSSLDVSWTDVAYNLDSEIAINEDSFVAYVTPYCRDEDGAPIQDVTLSVYRREFDGSYTEIQIGIDTTKNTVVTDPHPALDYARYRIVATSKSTGAISFYDPPGYPTGCGDVIIQWDEEWSNFDVTNDAAETVQPLWTGSLLRLPYNIEVSDNVTPEASLVNYIGRKYPVSYYGTSIDSTSSWNIAIDATDINTLYAIRRLQIWQGDVYVREPSGTGYWANIAVSYSKKYNDLTIPVTFDITRVEGGI